MSLDGPLRNIYAKSGKFEVISTGWFASLTMATDRANGLLLYSGDLAADYWIVGGRLEFTSVTNNLGDIVMLGGHVIHKGLLKDAVNLTMFGGWFEYAPTASVSTHNPDLYLLGGTFDLSKLTEAFVPTALVIGPGATVLGNLIGSGSPAGTSTSIDLSQDYPFAP